MRSVQAVVASLVVCTATAAFAQQRADAVLLVNSQSPSYADAQRHVRTYLDHFGVPYTVQDISTTPIGASISAYALIIIGHPDLDTTGTYLTAAAQANLVNAVALGSGLVSFDHDLSSNRVGRYSYVQQLFGFSYTWFATGQGVVFTSDAPNHFITRNHASGEVFSTIQVPAAAVVPDGSSTVLARFQDTNDPFLVVKPYGLGRAVQWGSSGWMSPPQNRNDFKGPLRGIDDLVWKSLAWAARKPFVMQGLPNFLTMRVDDVTGPVSWAHVANEFNVKPWMGLFYSSILGQDAIDIGNLTRSGLATATVHAIGQDGGFMYFDHFAGANYPDATIATNFQNATTWFNQYEIPFSKVVVPHFYEIGTNVFGYLTTWGVRSIGTHMLPGSGYTDTVPWLNLGPFRQYEAGEAQTAAPVAYADYLPIPGHPEYNNKFFNCVTEIRDDAGYEWNPDSTDVPGTIGRGTRQTIRAFNSMALATLFTHEYYIQPFTTSDWRSVMSGIMTNVAGYNPEFVTLDDACEYLRAKHDTRLVAPTYNPSTQQLQVQVTGQGDVPIRYLVFTDSGLGVQQAFYPIPAHAQTITVSQTLPPAAEPTLTSVTVSPSSASVAIAGTQQFSATAHYSDGTSIDATTAATWASSATTVATVGAATGVATGAGVGTAKLTATLSGVSGSATLTVSMTPLAIATAALPPGTQGIAYNTSLSATGGMPPYTWSAAPGALPAGLALSSSGNVSGTPTTYGDFSFTVTVTDSLSATTSATVTLSLVSLTATSLWPSSAVPTNPDRGPDGAGPVELGVKFESDVGGWITALRFYKSAANTGVHTGNLWTSSGQTLTSAIFTGETTSGWQQVWLVDPIPIDANTLYVASYHNVAGHYAYDYGYFSNSGRDRAPLHAPASATVAGNGVFNYGATSAFPSDSSLDSNYWVDVVFSPTAPGTITSISVAPATPSLDVGGTVQLTAQGNFSDASAHDVSGQVVWMSSNPSVATVGFLGAVTAVAPGTATISATSGQHAGSTTVTVLGPLHHIVVSPSSARLVAGATQPFSAVGYDALGSVRPGTTFTWSTTGGGSITSGGLFTAGASAGTFSGNVVATSGAVSGSASTETVAVASVSLSPASVTGGGSSTGTVTLSGAAPAGGAQVSLSSDTAGVTVPATVTVAAGATSATFTVSTASVGTAVTATITATLGGPATATLTVTPPAATGLGLSAPSVVGGGSVTGTVTLGGPAPAGGTVVTLSSSGAAATVPASVTVAAGASTATFTVSTSAVAADTGVTITAAAGGGAPTAVLTVAAPTPSALSVSPAAVTGGSGSTATVTLTGVAAAGGAVVSLASGSPSATVPATVTVAAGQTTATFTVTTTPVAQQAVVTLTASAGTASATTTLTVNPPTISQLTLSAPLVLGGTSFTGTVRLSAAAPAGGAAVAISSSSPSVTVPASVTVAAGATSATFTATTTPVAANTPVTVTVTYQGSQATASLTLAAPTMSSLSVSPTTVVGGATATGTVRLTGAAPTGGTVVTLGSNSASATVPATVTVAAGATTATFTVTTTPVATATGVTLTASAPTGAARTTTLTVGRPGVASVASTAPMILGGRTGSGTVTLNGTAPAGGIAVALSVDSGVASVPASVTVAAGSKTASFTISTSPVATNVIVTLSATLDGVTRTGTFTVARPSVSTVTVTTSTLTGGASTTGRVNLTGPAPNGGVAVQLVADAPITVPPTVTVPSGGTSVTFQVATAPVATTATPTLYATGGGVTKSTALTVLPPAVSGVSLSPASVAGGGSSTATVTLNGAAPAGGTVVTISSDSSAATVPASVTVQGGATTATFTVNTIIVGPSATAVVTASAGGGSATATLTVRGIFVTAFTVDPSTVTGGTGVTGTVTVSNPAPAGGFAVQVLSSDNAAASPPIIVTVPAGVATVTFAIPTGSVAVSTAVTLYATGGQATATATLTVQP